jgi:hypothetical protein
MAFLVCKDEILRVNVVVEEAHAERVNRSLTKPRYIRRERRETREDAHFVCNALENERHRIEFPAVPNC